MNSLNTDNSFLITAVSDFSAPDIESDIVVLNSDLAYITAENAVKYVYLAIKYSKRYCVYTITSRFIKDGCLTQCMISPKGVILGAQNAAHINLSYRDCINNGESLNIIETPFGNFFLAVDTDIYHPEVVKIAVSLGADIIVASRHTDLYSYMPQGVCIGSENAAVTGNICVFDVTNEGGILFTPDFKNCIREQSVTPKKNYNFKINLANMRRRNFQLENKTLYKKYLNLLER